MMCGVGALVTLELPDDSPLLGLPWIITFGPLDDEDEWEPVVCGPYEHQHAMALAESVVADEELMAVVEPVQPHVSIDRIRSDIELARQAVAADATGADGDAHDDGHSHTNGEDPFAEPSPPPSEGEVRAGMARIAARLTAS
jgi:hypothetical protein